MRTALVTGAAGFIGSHLVDALLMEGNWRVIAIDNFDPFYDPLAKEMNIAHLSGNERFMLIRADIRDFSAMIASIPCTPEVIFHLAAKVGVRPSVADPIGYNDVNVRGTQNMLDLAKQLSVGRFVFASSSSVYGVNPQIPWHEDATPMPISPYAATKLSCEAMGHVYSHLYGLRFIALRFFTVYGPRLRPDLAIHRFATLMQSGIPVPLFGDGTARRTYTFIGDAIRGLRQAAEYRGNLYEVFNIGSEYEVSLSELISLLESVTGLPANARPQSAQAGDVLITRPHLEKSMLALGYKPTTSLVAGLGLFWDWLVRWRVVRDKPKSGYENSNIYS